MDESMRFAHLDGHTNICYDNTGKRIITCGSDGDIRIWNGLEENDPQPHKMGDNVSAVAFKNNVIYLSSDNFSVSAYSFPEVEFDQILAQFNTTVHHIVCSEDGKLVAAGGGDFIIKVYDTSDKSLTAFRGHEGPILSLAFDPIGQYLASSGCDGTVRLWLLSNQECIKTLKLFKKSNDLSTSSTLCRIDWSTDGKCLAVPVEKEVRFYRRESWESKLTLTDDCIVKDLSIVTYSPFGKYISAAAVNGQMLVWDVETNQCISRKSHEKEIAICGLKWNPSGQELAFCDTEGQFGIYSSPLYSDSNASNGLQAPSHNENSDMEAFDDDIDNDFFNNEAFEDVNNKDVSDNEAFEDVSNKDISDNEAFEDVNNKDVSDNETFEGDNNKDLFEDDDDNAFDIGAIKASLEPKIFGTDDIEDSEQPQKETIEKQEPKIQVIEAPKAPVQAAFQPSSTPISLERRFMLWNDVGIVRSYNTEEENSIDVEFHDSNVYYPLHLNNTRNHTLAALSSEALLLASPKLDGNPSKLECMHFGTWDSNKEWIMQMPEDEEIEAVALGDSFAVCITDKMLVRVFSISGIQCEVFLLPGPVVSCTARNNQLLIVYHKGLGVDNNQCLNMMLVKVKIGGHCSTKECFVPLSSKAFLTWLGYTDEGSPCVADTSGIISVLSTSCGAKWIPVANSKLNLKGKSDTYFVIGLSEIKQEIRCILCKGSRYPALLPKPTIAVLPFSLPFCEMTADKSKLEEENRRYAIAHKCIEALIKEGFDVDSEFASVEKRWMDVLLKMFALATRNDREYRAFDVAKFMPKPVIVEGAIRYATQRHHIALAERLGEVMNEKLSHDIESDNEDDTELMYEDMSESLISRHSLASNLKSSKDDQMLKPKPILKRKGMVKKSLENNEEGSDLDAGPSETNHSSPSSLSSVPKSSPMANPFRATSKSQLKKKDIGNTSGIDEMLNNSMQSFAVRNSISNDKAIQPKKSRFPMKKDNPKKSIEEGNSEKGKNGFSLYFAENKEVIKASATPDVTEKELIKIAMKMYKELPKNEKEKYSKECNGNSNSPVDPSPKINNYYSLNGDISEIKENTCEQISSTPTVSSTKRKESDALYDDSTPKPKKNKPGQDKLPSSTIKKLTQFAFTKKPK